MRIVIVRDNKINIEFESGARLEIVENDKDLKEFDGCAPKLPRPRRTYQEYLQEEFDDRS